MKRKILLLLIATALFVLPVFWQTRNRQFRLDSDYDSALPILTYIVESVREKTYFPLKFPYMGGGISLISDPLSFVANPLVTIPAVLFGVEYGLRVTIFIIVFLSGVSVALFLSRLEIRGFVRWWATLLYMFSGGLGARIAAGHIEKILSFPLIPLFFYFTLNSSLSITRFFGVAATLTLIIFSGDFYMVWFLTIFFIIIKLFDIVTKRESILSAFFSSFYLYGIFFVLSSIKLIPFFTQVLPVMERFSAIDPYIGSIHTVFSFFPFMIPFRMAFYDRPVFQRIFGFYFNWYEYFVFISPLPFIFLVNIRSVLNRKALLLLVLIGTGALYVAVKYSYSPFYWLIHWFPIFGSFRVPQRIFTPMTPLVIGLLALCGQNWKRKKIVAMICMLSVLWTFAAGQQTVRLAFERPRIREEYLVKELWERDSGIYSVATYVCCLQTFLVQAHIPITNYYYGWKLKGFESFNPKYIIAPKTLDYSGAYTPFFETDIARVWKKQNQP